MIRVSGEKDICRLADKLREIIMTGEVDVWWTPRNILCEYPDTPEATLGSQNSGFKEDCCE